MKGLPVKDKKVYHIQEVKIKVEATDKGYYAGKIVKEGEKFIYEGALKDGEFPKWVKCIDDKFQSEFSKKKAPKKASAKPAPKADSLV